MRFLSYIILGCLGLPLLAGAVRAAVPDASATAAGELVRQGRALGKEGHFGAAVTNFEQAVALNPRDTNAYSDLGHGYYSLKEYPEAAAAFRQYLDLNPDNAEVRFWLGRSLYDFRQFVGAVTAYRQALALDPHYTNAYYGLGASLNRLGEYPAAAEALQRYVALRPGDSDGYRWLYDTLTRAGDFKKAEGAVRQLVALNPRNARYTAQLGWCLNQLDREEEAIRVLQQAEQLDPQYADARLWLGMCYYDQDAHVLSVAALKGCLALDPKNFDALYWLGLNHYEMHRYAEGADWLKQAVNLRPKSYNANLWRGLCLLRMGDYPGASANLEVAHGVKPEDRAARSAYFISLVILAKYGEAYRVFPGMFYFGGGALLGGYVAVMVLLLRRSLRVRPEATAPGFLFSLAWLLLFIEGELAFILILAALTLVGIHETALSAVILAAVPVGYAAVKGFARQPWGGPFAATLRPLSGRMAGWALLGLGVLVGADAVFTEVFTLVTHGPPPSQETVPFIQLAWHTNRVTALLAVVVVAPVTEEILFRGLVFGAVEGRLGRWGAIGVSAAVFAAAHFQFLYFVPLLICGGVLGWLRGKSGSLAPSMLVHCLNNGISLAGIMLFDKAG